MLIEQNLMRSTLKSLFLIVACFVFDIILNGLMGRLFFITTPLLYSYLVSAHAPRLLRAVSAFFVLTQAMLYGAASWYFCLYVLTLFIASRLLHKLLRDETWVRWIITICFFIIFWLLLPVNFFYL